ncbi:MAG TPA: hypothetical protein VGH66_19200 [Acidimicrobiales bacterium]
MTETDQGVGRGRERWRVHGSPAEWTLASWSVAEKVTFCWSFIASKPVRATLSLVGWREGDALLVVCRQWEGSGDPEPGRPVDGPARGRGDTRSRGERVARWPGDWIKAPTAIT